MTEPPPRIRPFLGAPGGKPSDNDGGHPDPRRSQVEQAEQAEQVEQAELRPYVLTAGRVQAGDPSIEVETQVSAVPYARPATALSAKLAAIVTLCAEPLSVAEISARLRIHLGVTRILVGDLRAAGLVHVHTMDPGQPHSPEMIMRVMRGLRAIS